MANCSHPSCAKRSRCSKDRAPALLGPRKEPGMRLRHAVRALAPEEIGDRKRAPKRNVVVFRDFVGGFLDWVHGRDERKYGVKWLWKTMCDQGELGAAARLYIDLSEFVAPKLARMEHAAAEGENLNIAVINYAPNVTPTARPPALPATATVSAEVVDGRPAR